MPGLLGAAELRVRAAALGVRPSKSLGQNFVHDANTVRRIVRLAGVTPGLPVLEIGPGLGSLTLGLLAADAQVTAVELDPVLAGGLAATVAAVNPAAVSRLTVLCADAVTLDPAALPAAPAALVANLPYNVAVPVLLHAVASLPSLRTALVMVQSEVAHRLAAAPGGRVYGVPSVKLRWWGTARVVAAVPRAVFWPVPNVDSALVAFTRTAPAAAEGLRAGAFAAVDAAFAQRRKTLRAALAGWAGSAAAAARCCDLAGIDPGARGETVDAAGYAALAAALPAVRGAAPAAPAAPAG